MPGAVFLRKGTNPEVDSYSAFFDNVKSSTGSTGLSDTLLAAGVTTVYVTGVATDYCVGFTTLDALGVGFTTFMVEDLSRGVADKGIAEMKTRVKEAGGILVQSNEVMRDSAAWAERRSAAGGNHARGGKIMLSLCYTYSNITSFAFCFL